LYSLIVIFIYFYQIGGRNLDVNGMAESFVETELGRLETDLKSLHAKQPRLNPSDEVHLLSILKAALGDDKDVLSDLVAPTLDAFACSSQMNNKLDRYTSGLLLQLKLKFVILVKEAIIISSNTPTPAEGAENEEIVEGPTVAAAEPPAYVEIEELMPSAIEQLLQQNVSVEACHKDAKEQTESEFHLVLEGSNVSTEKKVEFLARFRSLLERRLDQLLKKNDDKSKLPQEGTTRKRPHLSREEEEEELTNSRKKRLHVAEGRLDANIKREMDRLVRKYEDLMKKFLAGCSEPPRMSSHPSSVSVAPPQPVHPPPIVSIAIHLGWNHTHVGWVPPNKTTAELLFPPIPSVLGLSKDAPEVLYGDQIYKAMKKTLGLPDETQEEGGTERVSSVWLNLKSMLRDKEVKWRKGIVNSELPLAMFLIHVKTKIEAAIPPPSSSTKYKVIMVLPQVLSIVQRGRISDAAKLAGFGEDQVHLIKETTAAALAFAHDEDIWSPGSMLPILVCCRPTVNDSNTVDNNADAAIFSIEDGVLTMGEIAGRQGLQLMELRKEMTKFQRRIAPFEDEMNKKSVIVHLDDDGSYENVPCAQKGEMQDFRTLHDRVKRRSASESDDFLNKIREHLIKLVRCFHCLYDSFKRVECICICVRSFYLIVLMIGTWVRSLPFS
jgi:hypothetical protein